MWVCVCMGVCMGVCVSLIWMCMHVFVCMRVSVFHFACVHGSLPLPMICSSLLCVCERSLSLSLCVIAERKRVRLFGVCVSLCVCVWERLLKDGAVLSSELSAKLPPSQSVAL